MAKQSVALAANLRGMPDAFPTASDGWSTNGSISASSVARNTQTAEYWTNGASSSPAGMIDAVAAISSTALKNTQIDLSWTIILTNRVPAGPVFSYDMCVFIDWENPDGPKVTWSGRAFNTFTFYGIFSGKANINPLGSTVSMAVNRRNPPTSNSPPTMTLITGPNRNILGLPAPLTNAVRENAVPEAIGNYTITTDTGINVTAAPTPPAETSTEEVSGIKISELAAADSLIDTDLFVLSRDDPAGKAYDASYNVTLSKMRGRAVLFDGTNGLNVVNIMNLDSNETLTSNQLDFNLTMGTTNTVPDGFGGTKTVDLSSVPATARNILVFASIDSSQNEYCSWKYKHPSGSSWIYYIRSQDNGGYPNSNNSAVPLESGGKVDFQFNSSSAFGPLHSLDLHIVGYEL